MVKGKVLDKYIGFHLKGYDTKRNGFDQRLSIGGIGKIKFKKKDEANL